MLTLTLHPSYPQATTICLQNSVHLVGWKQCPLNSNSGSSPPPAPVHHNSNSCLHEPDDSRYFIEMELNSGCCLPVKSQSSVFWWPFPVCCSDWMITTALLPRFWFFSLSFSPMRIPSMQSFISVSVFFGSNILTSSGLYHLFLPKTFYFCPFASRTFAIVDWTFFFILLCWLSNLSHKFSISDTDTDWLSFEEFSLRYFWILAWLFY